MIFFEKKHEFGTNSIDFLEKKAEIGTNWNKLASCLQSCAALRTGYSWPIKLFLVIVSDKFKV